MNNSASFNYKIIHEYNGGDLRIKVYRIEGIEPVQIMERIDTNGVEYIPMLGNERLDDNKYTTLMQAYNAYAGVNWKAVGTIASAIAEEIYKLKK